MLKFCKTLDSVNSMLWGFSLKETMAKPFVVVMVVMMEFYPGRKDNILWTLLAHNKKADQFLVGVIIAFKCSTDKAFPYPLQLGQTAPPPQPLSTADEQRPVVLQFYPRLKGDLATSGDIFGCYTSGVGNVLLTSSRSGPGTLLNVLQSTG